MKKRVKVNAAGKFFMQKSHKRHLLKNKSKSGKSAHPHGKPVSGANFRTVSLLLHG